MRRVTRQQTRNEKQDQAYQQAQQTIRPSVVRFTQPASTIPPISAYPLQPAYSVSQRPVSSSQIPGPSVYFPGGFYQHYPSMMDQASPSQYVQQMGISTPSISSGPPPAPLKDRSRKSLKKITEAEEEAEVQTALAPLTQQFPDFPEPPVDSTSGFPPPPKDSGIPPPVPPPGSPKRDKDPEGGNGDPPPSPSDEGGNPVGDGGAGGGNPDDGGGDGGGGGGGGGPPGSPGGAPRGPSPPNTDDKDALVLWMMDFIRTSQDQHSALLHTLTTKESRPERPKTRTPDTYDGSDPKKLDPYISQCAAYIGSRWESFQGETDKVVWMHSYLKGSAHQHFAEQLSNASMAGLPPPAWYGSVQLFIDELTAVFGSPDPIADAIAAIESLSMRHGDKVHQYNLDFNRHAAKTLWDQNALRHRYYTGLPDRIKNELARRDKIFNLQSLQTVAWQIDTRHWEREAEKKREQSSKPANSGSKSGSQSNTSATSGSNNSASSSGSSETRKGKGKSKSNFRSTNSSNSASSSSSSHTPSISSPGPSQKPWAKNLGPDGKLLPAIREERMKKGLCLICGQAGHRADACPKAAPSSKARAASTSASPATPATASSSGSAPAAGSSSKGGSGKA